MHHPNENFTRTTTTRGGRRTELITVCEIAFVRLSNFWVICHSLHSAYACGRKRPRALFLFSLFFCSFSVRVYWTRWCANKNGLIDLLSVLYCGESTWCVFARDRDVAALMTTVLQLMFDGGNDNQCLIKHATTKKKNIWNKLILDKNSKPKQFELILLSARKNCPHLIQANLHAKQERLPNYLPVLPRITELNGRLNILLVIVQYLSQKKSFSVALLLPETKRKIK